MQSDPSSIKIYAYISSAWTELSDSGGARPIRIAWGMNGNSPLDRVADTGDMRLYLNNSTGQYTPGGPSALAGFVKGIPIKLVITYESVDHTYYYYIDDIDIKPSHKNKLAIVYCVDWLDYAERHPIVNPGILTNKRGDEVLTSAIADVEIQPTATDFDTGRETFATVFDTATSKTTVYKEMTKVAFSELGYCYQQHDGTLVFESADARHGWREPDVIPVSLDNSGLALNEDGDFALNEDGGFVANNELAAPPTFGTDVPVEDYDAPYGDNQINKMTVVAYPRRLGASPEVLFRLDKEIVIGSGQTYTLKGYYADPDGGLPINAQSVIQPVPSTGTDCSAFTATGGGGSNITSSLVIDSWAAGTEGFTAQLRNSNSATMHLYTFAPRGTAIRVPNPTEHAATNLASIAVYEVESQTLHQKYKNDTYAGRVFTDGQVWEHKDPRTVLRSITFTANKSAAAMLSFLYTDIGDLRRIEITELGIAGNYYIQGIEVTMSGKIITVTWIVIAALTLQTGCGLSPVAVEFAPNSTDAIDFGYLPNVYSDTTPKTFTVSLWINLTLSSDYIAYPFTFSNYGSELAFGIRRSIAYPGQAKINVFSSYYSDAGNWEADNLTMSDNTWYNILFTFNDFSSLTSDPIIYLNGTSVSVVEQDSPGGAVTNTMNGTHLIIGNINNSVSVFTRAPNGKIKDVRVYQRILSAAEVTTLYNSGTPDTSLVTDGLVFQAFAVRDEDLADYVDATLTSEMKLLDNIFKAVGEPNGSPIGRTP